MAILSLMSLDLGLLPSANSRTAEGSLYLLYQIKPLCHTNHSSVVHYRKRIAHIALHPSNRTAHGSVSVLNPHYVAKSPTSRGRGQGCARRSRYCPKGWTIQRTPMLVLSDCKTKKSRYTAVLYWCRGPWAKEPRAGVGPWRECSIWREELEPKGVEGWSSKLLCHISGSSADGSLNISASQCHWRDDAGEPRD
ncbi:hypothetical protein UFOVP1319_45 [uncultured Caudovirales phage]|uniref:Uncharacterized protein n=1 Tax=uncultured Caudovirales phage TaxID=2100421 RepID=A0A6J5RWL5_9CAUD|nr:hypothetical protein UFOVP478_28 [uncultured Caudovirales phage]CAB4190955.1 hypothetical protein UFOVP1225_3 [uncultured Caudovirales phage]CAB4197991.1 hypothetical protein UFOVP1319_45 [uncultured Caudovirales phage]CAB4216999.1 hypothetical protein UFOVP1591_3 [uncultured Caudovirales phage]